MDQFSDNPFANQPKQPPPYIPPPLHGDPKKIEEARASVAFLKRSNTPNAQIYDILVQRGIDHQTATQLIDSTMPEVPQQKKDRQAGINNMIFGALLIIAGIFFSVLSYDSVSESGGQYFVLYGPVIAGIWLFFKGVSQL